MNPVSLRHPLPRPSALAEALGYGMADVYRPMVEQIEEKSGGGKSGSGRFDRLKGQLSELFS